MNIEARAQQVLYVHRHLIDKNWLIWLVVSCVGDDSRHKQRLFLLFASTQALEQSPTEKYTEAVVSSHDLLINLI